MGAGKAVILIHKLIARNDDMRYVTSSSLKSSTGN
jgi:hypothetical protein